MKFDTPATANPTDRMKVLGKPLDRVDGKLKTTGTAHYAYERNDVAPNAAYGYILGSAIAKGRIESIDVADRPGDHLVRRPEREFTVFPRRGGGVRLHHHVALVRRGVALVDLHRCLGERTCEVADSGIGVTAFRLDCRALRCGEIEITFRSRVIDAEQLGGGTRLFERLCDDDSHGLIVMLDFGAGEHPCGVVLRFAELAGVLVGDDREHTGGGLRVGVVDALDPALGDRRA